MAASKLKKERREVAPIGELASGPELASLLQGQAAADTTEQLKICVVTNELAEFHQNGGLGTATTGLIHALGRRGFSPTVLYTARLDRTSEKVRAGMVDLQKRGINFICLQDGVPAEWMNSPRKISYACYWLLKDKLFNIIHFNDYLGNAFYCAQAKRTSTALQDSTIITTVHGPTRWAMSIDQRPINEFGTQEICFIEKRALEMSDVVLGVSHHLIRWLRGEGLKLPSRTYVHKNILPKEPSEGRLGILKPGQLAEVVFFARQDVRKGFSVMLNAIKILSKSLPQLKFVFLGKFSTIAGEHSGAVALDELRHVANLVEFRTDYDRSRAMRFLRRPGCLAVIPSLDENSPCTVFECITGGIPFIASKVGGIPELVEVGAHGRLLFLPNPKALAETITNIFQRGYEPAQLPFQPEVIEEQMVSGFRLLHETEKMESLTRRTLNAKKNPHVSIIITHFNRPAFLGKLLKTIEEQIYKNFEVILVDDGSTDPAAVEFLDRIIPDDYSYSLTVVRIVNSYLGAARNAGVNASRGEYIKFQDDDNIPLPVELQYFVTAAVNYGADVVTGMGRFFRSEEELKAPMSLAELEYFPLGESLPISLFGNEYGDANALVRRSSFIEDGGFTEIYGVGSEDYEFFLKSESCGRKIAFVPEPIFNYRLAAGSMLQSTSAYMGAKRARSGLKIAGQKWVEELVDYSHEMQLSRDIKHQAWWRAGKRNFHQLHQQLMDGPPDSHEAINRFLELAVCYERIEDVVQMVLRRGSLIDSLNWIESSSKKFDLALAGGRRFLRRRPQIINFSTFSDIELIAPLGQLPGDFQIIQVQEDGVLVHPLSNKTVQAMVSRAIPAGTFRIVVPFSHRATQGNPVRVAIEIVRHGQRVAISNWMNLLPGGGIDCVLELERPILHAADLIVMSAVDGAQDFSWVFADKLCIEVESFEAE